MRWLRPLRPKREWARHVSVGQVRPPVPLPPTPRELIEVIGVGKTEVVNGVALTLLSLERYREGDVVTFRLTAKRGLHLDFPSPELFIAAGPSASPSIPRFFMMGGGGGGGGNELTFRYSYGFGPGMPEEATDWVIEVTRIEWVRHYRSPERKVASVDAGPWRFTIRP